MEKFPSLLVVTSPDGPENNPKVSVDAWNNREPDKLALLFNADAKFVNVTGLWWHVTELFADLFANTDLSFLNQHRYGCWRKLLSTEPDR